MTGRQRVKAVIIREDRVLMLRERARSATGLHDGPEYWTLPGGGVEPGETCEQAVAREVLEEVGLRVTATEYTTELPYPSGAAACFRVEVADGEPTLGVDPLECDCPKMVGLNWIPIPDVSSGDAHHVVPVPALMLSIQAFPVLDP
ncbi:MAG: NUDIX domain-containing protein [Euzebyales bacterium]|nr:NUDIX domain-containing protein [Euzebyales bacterium]